MITKTQLKKIKEFAIDLDWNKAFDGKSKGNMHLFRVIKTAKQIAKELNENIDKNLIEAGAWLHDSGLAKNISGGALCNQNSVIEFLQSIKINKNDIQKIIHCIESHDGKNKAITTEAKIIHDADTLDKMGPLGIIRETWKRSQMGWTTEKIAWHLQRHLKKRENNLYTETAKKMAKTLEKPLNKFFHTLKLQL